MLDWREGAFGKETLFWSSPAFNCSSVPQKTSLIPRKILFSSKILKAFGHIFGKEHSSASLKIINEWFSSRTSCLESCVLQPSTNSSGTYCVVNFSKRLPYVFGRIETIFRTNIFSQFGNRLKHRSFGVFLFFSSDFQNLLDSQSVDCAHPTLDLGRL